MVFGWLLEKSRQSHKGLEGIWCPDCIKFYHIGETTCEGCGQELLKCYNIHYETRAKPKTGPLFRSKPRNKKRKLKR